MTRETVEKEKTVGWAEKDTFQFKLKAGEKREIQIRVLPRLPVIRIIEGGEIFLEEKKEE